jgi:hypothetical protein
LIEFVVDSLLSVTAGFVIALTPPAMKQVRTTAATLSMQYEDVQRIEVLQRLVAGQRRDWDGGGAIDGDDACCAGPAIRLTAVT